jgi:hypothetical protein
MQDCRPRQGATADHPECSERISCTRGEKSETVLALGNSSRRKKIVSKPLNENLGDDAMDRRDGHKNRMKHLLNA